MKFRLLATGALVALGVVVAPVAANATSAAPPQDTVCDIFLNPLSNHPDSGNAGTWALDEINRTTKICAVGAAVEGVQTYHATVTDDGTFTAISGAGAPNGVGTITAAVTGTTKGGFTADFTAKAGGPTGNHGATTSTWVQGYFGEEAKGSFINDDWKWVYTTCSEKWTDAASNSDGQGAQAGNITGKECVKPSPSPSTSTPAPTPTAPAPVAVPVTLPVTG